MKCLTRYNKNRAHSYHVWMVPLDPGYLFSIGRNSGTGVKVTPICLFNNIHIKLIFSTKNIVHTNFSTALLVLRLLTIDSEVCVPLI